LGGKNKTNVRVPEKNGGYYPVTSDWRENGEQLFGVDHFGSLTTPMWG